METLKIKNFFPVADADIEIKPLTVFIGESASGKSVILKLLSLFRWIHKKVSLRELSKKVGKNDERFRIEKMLRDSGLEDFCVKGSIAEYTTDDFYARIACNGKLQLKTNWLNKKNPFTLEKIAFVPDDRFSIPLLLNNQLRVITIPFHLEKTFEDFRVAFDALSAEKKVKIETFNVELLRDKYGIQHRFFIKNQGGAKTQLHNASSGMKSVSTIEVIAQHFANDKEYVESGLNNYVVSLFSKLKEKDPAAFVNKIKKAEFNKPRFSLFIEEPELSLFPDSQKTLLEYLVRLCFNQSEKDIQLAFSTHSPYILTTLNVFLTAHQIAQGNESQKEQVRKIIPEHLWLDAQQFNAFKVKDGKVEAILKNNLICADEIDEASETIEENLDALLEIPFLK